MMIKRCKEQTGRWSVTGALPLVSRRYASLVDMLEWRHGSIVDQGCLKNSTVGLKVFSCYYFARNYT